MAAGTSTVDSDGRGTPGVAHSVEQFGAKVVGAFVFLFWNHPVLKTCSLTRSLVA